MYYPRCHLLINQATKTDHLNILVNLRYKIFGYRSKHLFIDTEIKFVAVVAKAMNSYQTGVVAISQKYLLQERLKANNCKILLWAEGATWQEAKMKAVTDHLNSCNSDDERAGLMFHYQDTLQLQGHIRAFRSLNLRQATENEIIAHLEPIAGMYDVLNLTMKSGACVYRARRLNQDRPYYFTAENELWAPPAECVRMGRLNKEGESLLYTSHSPTSLPSELRLAPGDEFCLIRYRIKAGKNLILASIGLSDQDQTIFSVIPRDQSTWTKQAKINREIIMDFLTTEFTKDVGYGTEYLYRASVLIGHSYFRRPETHGYIYKSVAHKAGYNIAIKGELAKEILEFVGLRIYKFISQEADRMLLDSCTIQSNSIVGGILKYTDSPTSKDLDFFAR